MKTFVTSDHHFFHGNIIKYCNRPFKTWQEMNEVMIKKWNDVVSKDDLVIHLGDFCLYGLEKVKQIRKQLNGTIILIKGNHDQYRGLAKCGFIVKRYLKHNNILFTHRPIPLEELREGFINIFGHIHTKDVFDKTRQFNVSVDKTNFYPVLLDDVLKSREHLHLSAPLFPRVKGTMNFIERVLSFFHTK